MSEREPVESFVMEGIGGGLDNSVGTALTVLDMDLGSVHSEPVPCRSLDSLYLHIRSLGSQAGGLSLWVLVNSALSKFQGYLERLCSGSGLVCPEDALSGVLPLGCLAA